MGDRANVYVVTDEGAGVYLYTHWHGWELPGILADALASQAGQNRWQDPSYLTRIIFSRMSRGEENSEHGFGISSRITDNEYPILVVMPGVGVGVAPEGSEQAWTSFMTVQDFIALAAEGWDALKAER